MIADTVAIVLAAGTSRRMGGTDKIWSDLGGRPVLAHSLATFAALGAVARIVVVAPAAQHEAVRALAPAGVVLTCVEGGARRQDSVAAGLAA
ncbi:MAG: 2-C-methyl-D-erythritol 4-phosphate cytidylyltransferase, partial [Dehalococcoidia bacterium]|nr:2-C-methyl-D-erythritol 4-phosphate cytidylyltransferase [Dehalococcoidia bacterium]